MSKEFLKDPPNYRLETAPETPFLRARQEWDNRIGASAIQAKNWRLACLGAITCSMLTVGALTIQIRQNKIIPVIVGIDKERGEPMVLGRADQYVYKPQLQEIKYFLSNFITLVRAVPSDPVLIKQNWLKAYAFLRRDAANVLNDLTNRDENSPLKRLGELTVLIQPIAVVQIDGGNSYQARWEESIYDGHGSPVERFTMTGIFTIEIQPPRDENSLSNNPLGFYITNFQWNREL